jgi:hypothetical protein
MNDGFSWWLVVLGIAVGIGLVWLFTVRLPVGESDIDEEETIEEAGWISETIESWGGVAPAPLVQEVLELHKRYLNGDRSTPASNDDLPNVPADAAAAPPEIATAGTNPASPATAASVAPPPYPPAGGFAEIPPRPKPE